MPSIAEDELGRLNLLVDQLGHDLDPSILIGGWATHLRVGGEISKDIDLIINSPALRTKLREVLDDYTENSHHSGGRKGRGTVNGIHIDAYIPHESALGDKMRLDVAKLAKYTDSTVIKGWLLLTRDAHTVTKIAALLDRPDSEKGEKDAREIVRLLRDGATAAGSVEVMLDACGGDQANVPGFVSKMFELIPDRADLNKKERRWLADLRRDWVDEAERQYRRLSSASKSVSPDSVQPRDTRGKYGHKQNTPPSVRLR